jgi:Leucine-rich repeat (LRR) protein
MNNINGPVATLLERLHGKSLDQLILFENNLAGNLPDQLGHLSNLTSLDLSSNLISGEIPLGIGGLTKLTELVLGDNYFHGAITERHFVQLSNLNYLDLSENSLAMVVQDSWVPPFNLGALDLQSCRLGPKFPAWLRTQNSAYLLDISNTSIAGSIPFWFWITFSRTRNMVLSSNHLSGMLPSAMFQEMEADTMDLSRNFLTGPIPKLPRKLTSLDLSRNNLSGPLPLDFGGPMLSALIVFGNSLSGGIPNSFCDMEMLEFVELSGNLLEGQFPNCGLKPRAGNPPRNHSSKLNLLKVLNLNGNNFSGPFPPFLQRCQKLIFLDIGFNKFYGTLPTWVGKKLPSLAFLSVRSNLFSGQIPLDLSGLTELQYLDLACNNMSGSIPLSLVKLMAMTLSPAYNDSLDYVGHYGEDFNGVDVVSYAGGSLVVFRGQQIEYTTGIMYMVNFDLSCNSLTGPIPEEIGELVALKNLNLSWNHLSGIIPDSIGGLRSMESLDLSHNEFSGEIPASLSALTSLSHLNISYNNLTGEIPSGNQLQTLDDPASIYIGNPGLCGSPLSRNCSEVNVNPTDSEENGHGSDDAVSIFLGTCVGYVAGLWTVFCVFLFKMKWRAAWFSHFDSFCGRVYVKLAIWWAHITRKNEMERR